MKKILVILAIITALALTACGSSSTNSSPETTTAIETTNVAELITDVTTEETTTIETEETTTEKADEDITLKEFTFKNMTFSAPDSWEQGEQTDESFILYADDGLLTIQPFNVGYSVTNKELRESILESAGIQYDSDKEVLLKDKAAYSYYGRMVYEDIDNDCYISMIENDGDDFYTVTFTYFENTHPDYKDIYDHLIKSISIEQTKEPETEVKETTVKETTTSGASLGEQNALESALTYLKYSSFSYDGLIGQLEYEGFTHDEAVYAVENCGADWMEQASLEAASYLRSSSFSYQGLIDQLKYEGFTDEQAIHAVDNCGADWKEQAAKTAEAYMKSSSFSKEGLIDQLLYEGFSQEEAEYGAESVGY